jgi:hypothetical protein
LRSQEKKQQNRYASQSKRQYRIPAAGHGWHQSDAGKQTSPSPEKKNGSTMTMSHSQEPMMKVVFVRCRDPFTSISATSDS